MNSYTSEAAETENRSTRIAAFTLFASSTETIGKLARSTFKDLAAKLTAPQLAGSDQTKETLPMISFAEFTGNRRAKDNIIRVHALVLDYDNEHEVETDERDPQDIRRRLKRKEALPLERRVAPETALNVFDGLEACAYSSWSHSSELTKFRLIVPFSRAVTPTEWERVTRWARSQLAKADHVVDPASWSAAQAWYRPRRREGQDFIGIHREGRPLDVDAVLRHVPEETTVSERPTRWTGTRLSAYANALNAAVSMPVLLRELGIEVSKAGFVNLRGERTASAKVYDDHVHDFGSHETFYPVTLTAKTKGITYRAALEWLANFVGFEPFDWATSGLPEKVDPTEEINALPAELPATGWADTIKHAVAAISTQDDTDIAHWVRVLVAKYGKAFPGKASEVERLVRAHVREAKEARKAAAPATATTPEYTFDENGWLCEVVTNHQLGVVNRPLANFTATIERVVTYEDEITPRTVFVVAGKLSTGEVLPTLEIDGAEFEEMRWVLARWGGKAFFSKDRSSAAAVRDYILRTSTHAVETVHTSLGWFDAGNGRHGYRHAKGVVGAGVVARVQVSGDRLNMYALPGIPESDATWARTNVWECKRGAGKAPPKLTDAIRRSLALLDVAAPAITYVPYAATVSAVAPGLQVPKHMVSMIAPSKSFKTSLALEYMRHFGDAFGCEQDLPLNYQGTSVPVAQYVLSAAANALVVVDDARPRTSQRDGEAQKSLIEFLARRQGRDKSNRDGTPRPARTPRASVLSTWELDFAPVSDGESTSARVLKVKFNRGDIDGKKLETIQKLGQHAYAMRAYIEWIASNYRLTMATNMSFYADDLRAFRAAEGLDGRQPEDLAHLLTGFRAFLLFALDLGVITAAEMEERIIAGRGALLDVARGQTTETRGASHEARYIALVSDAIRSGRYRLVDAAAPLTDDALGWVDDKHVYLDPGITQAAIVLLARERNEAPPLPTSALYERLVHAGLASPPNEKGRAGTRRSLGGGRVRVIEFALSVFEDLVLERMARHRDAANDPEIVRALEDEPVVAEPAPNASSPERMIDDAHSTETARRGSLAPDGTRLVCPVVGPPRLAIRAGEASTIYAVSIDGTIVDAATFTYTLPEGEALETLRRRVAAIKPEGLRAHLERIDGSWIIEKIEPVVDEAA